jgi:hypothetical protein
MNVLKQIDELLKEGYPLQGIGINNWAFSKKDAMEILNRFEELKVSILGGDVYELTNNIVQPNYDNWYFNRLSNETDIEFLKRSIKRAKDYITNYIVRDPSQIFFAFVLDKPGSEME